MVNALKRLWATKTMECYLGYVANVAALGRHDEARALFENLLTKRNRLGLLAEHINPRTGE